MIESLLSPRVIRNKPWEAFISGFIFTLVAALLTLQIGTSSPCSTGLGLLCVGFISIAATPLFLNIFRMEESKREGNIIERHRNVIAVYAFFFVGVVIASSLFYVLVPQSTATYLFSDQTHDLVGRGIIDSGIGATGSATAMSVGFLDILVNNLRVLFLAFVFSFVFGAGAVFIITWNATILGVLVAKIAESPAAYGSFALLEGNILVNYVIALPFTLIRLLPHGIFEFGGYFLGAIAGGILSVAIIHNRLRVDWRNIFNDSLIYLLLGAVAIVAGAAIETAL